MTQRVPFSRPNIDEEDIQAVTSALRSEWLAFGPEKDNFEAAFAQRIGVAHAVTTNSCTSALEITLIASGITGEVVVPSFTWVATANAVLAAGAQPVFCDVDLDTGNMTASSIERAITPRTEAVIIVHYAGQPCQMDEIVALCSRHNLLLIEDCAETLGGTWRGRIAGSFGVGCFSFYPTKAITTGEGGMIVTGDPHLAERARTLVSHGVSTSPPLDGTVHPPWERAAVLPGHNYRLSNVLCALGLNQLRKLDVLNGRRVALAESYGRHLAVAADRVVPLVVSPHATHVYQLYAVRIARGRNQVLRKLWDARIAANVHFDPPVHRQPLYSTADAPSLPNTDRLSASVLSLPIYPDMSADEQNRAVDCLLAALAAE
jgi:dTDP-4-amino-4,6-dideoxygalactose transaminase